MDRGIFTVNGILPSYISLSILSFLGDISLQMLGNIRYLKINEHRNSRIVTGQELVMKRWYQCSEPLP